MKVHVRRRRDLMNTWKVLIPGLVLVSGGLRELREAIG